MNPEFIDTLCDCGHWYEEHTKNGCELGSPFEEEQCEKHEFNYNETLTNEALEERK